MAYLDVDPDAAARSLPHGFSPAAPSVTVAPPAQDPASVGVAGTLSARVDAITAYSGAARAITDIRSAMLRASANSYQHQEQVNTAGLGPDGLASAAQPSMPSAAIPPLPPATIPPPSLGAPPASARAISELIHSGPGPAGLYAAAQQMRRHASQLADTANQLHTRASALTQDWDSDAGREAAARMLGDWHDTHALHATAAAAALEQQADNYSCARTAIPTPERFDELQRRLHSAIAANQTPGSFGRPLRADHQRTAHRNREAQQRNHGALRRLHQRRRCAQRRRRPAAGAAASGGRDVQALDVPLAPPPQFPPHGKGPPLLAGRHQDHSRPSRSTRTVWHHPDRARAVVSQPRLPVHLPGAPAGGEIPARPQRHRQHRPRPAGATRPCAAHPDIPGNLLGPRPRRRLPARTAVAGPQQPIDVRDIIHVPEGSLAPYGTIQYLPGWFVYPPSNTVQLPQPR